MRLRRPDRRQQRGCSDTLCRHITSTPQVTTRLMKDDTAGLASNTLPALTIAIWGFLKSLRRREGPESLSSRLSFIQPAAESDPQPIRRPAIRGAEKRGRAQWHSAQRSPCEASSYTPVCWHSQRHQGLEAFSHPPAPVPPPVPPPPPPSPGPIMPCPGSSRNRRKGMVQGHEIWTTSASYWLTGGVHPF